MADRRFIFKLGPNAADSAAAMVAELARTEHEAGRHPLLRRSLRARWGPRPCAPSSTKAGIDVTPARRGQADRHGHHPGRRHADRQRAGRAARAGRRPDQAALAATSAKAASFTGRLYFDAAAAGDLFIPQEAAAATNNATMVFTQILAIDDVIATTPAKASRKQWFRDYTSRYGSYSGVAVVRRPTPPT